MGRLFDGPWALIVIFLIIVAVVVVLVVTSMNKSKKTDFAYIAPPSGDQYPGTPSDAAVQRDYRQGMSHRLNSTIFGVIGLFILGIVFGPLALVQANKAEALGVKASAGRALGWTAVGLSTLWLIFIVARMASR
ncbi:hypothetical protein [Arthrobacter sp. ZGTC131]|uniref:hypothetical protein n=1 Tax=Arthrobacter sp. ZGTC131 TaxID=2058898 RepID=UPI000CE51459|nr:hypothetical protein [Arthrobacter sp. ZGTC131]